MRIKLLILLVSVCATVALGGVAKQDASALPSSIPVSFANDVTKCNRNFFGLSPWYAYMPDTEIGVPKRGDAPADPCGIKCFNIFVQSKANECGETASDIPGIVLAVIDDLLRIAGLVAVGFLLKGAFEFVGSRGNAERTAAAQSTIMASLTGLAIALVSVALVSYLGAQLH